LVKWRGRNSASKSYGEAQSVLGHGKDTPDQKQCGSAGCVAFNCERSGAAFF